MTLSAAMVSFWADFIRGAILFVTSLCIIYFDIKAWQALLVDALVSLVLAGMVVLMGVHLLLRLLHMHEQNISRDELEEREVRRGGVRRGRERRSGGRSSSTRSSMGGGFVVGKPELSGDGERGRFLYLEGRGRGVAPTAAEAGRGSSYETDCTSEEGEELRREAQRAGSHARGGTRDSLGRGGRDSRYGTVVV